jgi:hypothetical protein
MTLWDNTTHGRAKGLWTGASMRATGVPLGRKAAYGKVSETPVLSFSCSGSEHGLRPSIRLVPSRVCGRRAPAAAGRLKVMADGQFEAVLGKTRRTEF